MDLHDDDFVKVVELPKLKDSDILIRKVDDFVLNTFPQPEKIRLLDVKEEKLALAARISIDRH